MPDKILIIEDDPSTRLLYIEELKDAGYTLFSAENGSQAIGVLEKEPIDLVMTDLRMAEISGETIIEFLHRFRPKVPVVVVSGTPRNDRFGDKISAYFVKPVNLQELKTRVADLLSKRTL